MYHFETTLHRPNHLVVPSTFALTAVRNPPSTAADHSSENISEIWMNLIQDPEEIDPPSAKPDQNSAKTLTDLPEAVGTADRLYFQI